MNLKIEKNKNLKACNTFGLEATAPFFCEVHSTEELQSLFRRDDLRKMPLLILGGGSNVLFTRNPEGLVVLNKIEGTEIIKEDKENVWLKAGAGVVWHALVIYTISNGWGGIENLSLIPGTTGAAPMQNIGAYGAEIKDTFYELEAVDRSNGNIKLFRNEDCCFGYRSSVFKTTEKDKYVIATVTFKLKKQPVLNTTYGAIQETLEAKGITKPGLKDVSDAVIEIRRSKLPDPKSIGNAGSFFKNPVISPEHYSRLRKDFPAIPSYPQPDGIKVPAGWLIEQAGWKGHRRGNVGVHEKQALVLVNYGGAKGEELKLLSEDIQASVKEKYEIELETEVNFI